MLPFPVDSSFVTAMITPLLGDENTRAEIEAGIADWLRANQIDAVIVCRECDRDCRAGYLMAPNEIAALLVGTLADMMGVPIPDYDSLVSH